MAIQIQITSGNYNGQLADITFYPCYGAPAIYLGYQIIPYTYENDNYQGQYSLYFSAYNKDMSPPLEWPINVIPVVSTKSNSDPHHLPEPIAGSRKQHLSSSLSLCKPVRSRVLSLGLPCPALPLTTLNGPPLGAETAAAASGLHTTVAASGASALRASALQALIFSLYSDS
jgi:hypothetical protein